MTESFNKIIYYESICYATKKNKKLSYNIKKFYRYFYLKSAAFDYAIYKCENKKAYILNEINIYKYEVINGKTFKKLIYKKLFS